MREMRLAQTRGQNTSIETRHTWVGTLTPPHTGYMTLGKSSSLSELQFFPL